MAVSRSEVMHRSEGKPTDEPPVEDGMLRAVCGQLLTGVTIVTSSTRDQSVGATINSFTSVSLDPPLVLFCLQEGSHVLQAIRAFGVFAVNILAEEQASVCRAFATPGVHWFDDIPSRPGMTGAPILTDTLGYLDCRVVSQHPAGDHWIVMGRVVDLGVLRDGKPLAFFRGSYPRLDVDEPADPT